MNNVDTAQLALIDDRFTQPQPVNGVVTLPINQAYQELDWVQEHFVKKPEAGYLVWVKEQPANMITLCVLIETNGFKQELENLLVIEPEIEAELRASCELMVPNLSGQHHAQGKLVLKAGSSLKYSHYHTWGRENQVSTDYKFYLGAGSRLEYSFYSQHSPAEMDLKTEFYLAEQAQAQIKIAIEADQTNFNLQEKFYLQGEGADAVSRLRLVGRQDSKIKADSQLIAEAAGKGHLDCQGLNLSPTAELELIPSLLDQHPGAELTHEAAVGKIAPEKLHYLRSRGLTEEEAINLIVTGFLG